MRVCFPVSGKFPNESSTCASTSFLARDMSPAAIRRYSRGELMPCLDRYYGKRKGPKLDSRISRSINSKRRAGILAIQSRASLTSDYPLVYVRNLRYPQAGYPDKTASERKGRGETSIIFEWTFMLLTAWSTRRWRSTLRVTIWDFNYSVKSHVACDVVIAQFNWRTYIEL